MLDFIAIIYVLGAIVVTVTPFIFIWWTWDSE